MPDILDHANKLIIYTDGGARGNPGPAGIGVVMWKDGGAGNGLQHLENIKRYIGETTNNFAEYTALITALERALELGYRSVQCFLDSELVVRQLNGQYKIKEPTLKPLAEKVKVLSQQIGIVAFTHVPRVQNADADKLVNQAVDEHLKSI